MSLEIPDMVPTFELEFQLAEEMFGAPLIDPDVYSESFHLLPKAEQERQVYKTAEYFAHVYGELEYSIIPAYGPGEYMSGVYKLFFKYLKELTGETVMLGYHGDGTFAIPAGSDMYAFSYRIADDPDAVKAEAKAMALAAIERNKRIQELGVECLFLCSDYCYNTGPFVSPPMFAEYIQPYLYMIIDAARKDGMYTIKHTDGNIMPILDMMVECRPNAIHSIDPMAGVDIKEVKRLVGDKVALCGNVHCAAMQTGTDEDVLESAEYAMTHGKPGGGYFFTTSNCPFNGMPPERYRLVLDYYRKTRTY